MQFLPESCASLVAGHGRAVLLSADGEFLAVTPGSVAHALSGATPLVVHRPATLRRLGNPAVDVLDSVSRLNRDLLAPAQLELTAAAREHLAVYRRNQDLINIGAYPAGSNPAIDQAIALHDPLTRFLRQGVTEGFTTDQSWSLLEKTMAPPVPAGKPVTLKK